MPCFTIPKPIGCLDSCSCVNLEDFLIDPITNNILIPEIGVWQFYYSYAAMSNQFSFTIAVDAIINTTLGINTSLFNFDMPIYMQIVRPNGVLLEQIFFIENVEMIADCIMFRVQKTKIMNDLACIVEACDTCDATSDFTVTLNTASLMLAINAQSLNIFHFTFTPDVCCELIEFMDMAFTVNAIVARQPFQFNLLDILSGTMVVGIDLLNYRYVNSGQQNLKAGDILLTTFSFISRRTLKDGSTCNFTHQVAITITIF
jgi:hypothetical protein